MHAELRLFEPALVRMAIRQSFVMLDPRNMMRNPVMFLVEVGTVLTLIATALSIAHGAAFGLIVYQAALTVLLLLTVLFANFAEALAEARGKAQADSLRATRAGYAGLSTATGRGADRPDRLFDTASEPATISWSRPARSFRPMARLSKGWPRSTSRRSPARAHR